MAEIYRYPLDLGNSLEKSANGIVKITIKERKGEKKLLHFFLPAPSSFSFADGATFSNFEKGELGMAVDQIAKATKGFMDGGLEGAQAALGLNARGASDVAGGVSAFSADAAATLMVAAGGLQSANEAAFAAGAAVDKGARQRFVDNTIREFSLNFQMSPRNKDENKAIDQIIKLLRRYTYASRGDNTFALNYPPEMLVEFYHKDKANKFMPVLMPSYLKGLSTTYNPNSFALHEDGGAEQYDLALNFGEIKRLTREELVKLEEKQLNEERHNELYKLQQNIAEATEAGTKEIQERLGDN